MSTHIGRAWSGVDIEQECPCPQAACGLVIDRLVSVDCKQHSQKYAPSIRQGHKAQQCTGAHMPTRRSPARLRASTALRMRA